MKIILALFFYVAHQQLCAQESVFTIVEKANKQLLSIEKGEYSVTYKSKSVFDADTFVGNGRVQYFKTQGGPGDSIARFVLWPDKGPLQSFDGTFYWTINNDQNEVVSFDVAQKKGIQDYITHYNSARTHILSVPILTNKGYQPFNPADFTGWNIRPFYMNDSLFIAMDKSILKPNKQKLTPTDGDSILIIEQWLIYPDIYLPRRKSLIVDRQNGLVSFDEINYSLIRQLPDTLELQDVFSIASMLQQGYKVVEKPVSRIKATPLLAVGDSVPNFNVRLETGDTLPLFTAFKQRYLVLDFWYRSCAPCNLAMPGLDRTTKALYGKDVAIVGINPIDKQYDRLIKQYKKQYGYTFDIAFAEKSVTEQLKIWAYPTTFVVDTYAQKVIHLGNGEELELREYLEGLLR